jgi:hypothetical protein
MHLIEIYLHKFLEQIKSGAYKVSEEELTSFSEEAKKALKRQFERDQGVFSIRMSNIGRPLCSLQYEQAGYNSGNSIEPMRALLGDLTEDIVLFMLRAAKVPIVAEQELVTLNIGDIKLSGTLDLIIDFNEPKIWDIKSASGWSFQNKFKESFDFIFRSDNFGYCEQLFLYAEAKGIKAGGFIVFDKSSGEIVIVAVPEEQEFYRKAILERVDKKIKTLSTFSKFRSGEPEKYIGGGNNLRKDDVRTPATNSSLYTHVDKQFALENEIFKKKPTGKKLLAKPCTFCAFKFNCWKNARFEINVLSTAKTSQFKWYADGPN